MKNLWIACFQENTELQWLNFLIGIRRDYQRAYFITCHAQHWLYKGLFCFFLLLLLLMMNSFSHVNTLSIFLNKFFLSWKCYQLFIFSKESAHTLDGYRLPNFDFKRISTKQALNVNLNVSKITLKRCFQQWRSQYFLSSGAN